MQRSEIKRRPRPAKAASGRRRRRTTTTTRTGGGGKKIRGGNERKQFLHVITFDGRRRLLLFNGLNRTLRRNHELKEAVDAKADLDADLKISVTDVEREGEKGLGPHAKKCVSSVVVSRKKSPRTNMPG